eukprot:29943-Pelagococcus_subviridis.AAC.4
MFFPVGFYPFGSSLPLARRSIDHLEVGVHANADRVILVRVDAFQHLDAAAVDLLPQVAAAAIRHERSRGHRPEADERRAIVAARRGVHEELFKVRSLGDERSRLRESRAGGVVHEEFHRLGVAVRAKHADAGELFRGLRAYLPLEREPPLFEVVPHHHREGSAAVKCASVAKKVRSSVSRKGGTHAIECNVESEQRGG